MDSLWQIGLKQLVALTSNYSSGWATASANFGVMEMYSNNNNCANAACTSGTTSPGGDVGTNYDNSSASSASQLRSQPRQRHKPARRHPQEVLFIVTDGVRTK